MSSHTLTHSVASLTHTHTRADGFKCLSGSQMCLTDTCVQSRQDGERDGGMEGGRDGWRDGWMEGWRDGVLTWPHKKSWRDTGSVPRGRGKDLNESGSHLHAHTVFSFTHPAPSLPPSLPPSPPFSLGLPYSVFYSSVFINPSPCLSVSLSFPHSLSPSPCDNVLGPR